MASQARQFLAALMVCSTVGCQSTPSNTEEPAAGSTRQQSAEGKMKEWLGRVLWRSPPTGARALGKCCHQWHQTPTQADAEGIQSPPLTLEAALAVSADEVLGC